MALFLLRLRGGGGRCGADGRSAGTRGLAGGARPARRRGISRAAPALPAGVRLLGGLRLAGGAAAAQSQVRARRSWRGPGRRVCELGGCRAAAAARLSRPAAGDAADRPDQHADGRGDRPACAPDPDRAGAAFALRRRDREEQLRLVRFHGAGQPAGDLGHVGAQRNAAGGLVDPLRGAGRGAALGARRGRPACLGRSSNLAGHRRGAGPGSARGSSWQLACVLAQPARRRRHAGADRAVGRRGRSGAAARLAGAAALRPGQLDGVRRFRPDLPAAVAPLDRAGHLAAAAAVRGLRVPGDALRGAARPGSGRAAHRGGARDLVRALPALGRPGAAGRSGLRGCRGGWGQPRGLLDRHRAGRDRRRCAPCGWPTLCRRPVRDQQHLRRQPGRDGVRCRCRAVPGHRSLREGAGCRIDEFARALPVGTARGLSRARLPGAGGRPHALSGSVHPLRARAAKPGVARRPLTGPGGGLGG